MKRFIAVAFFAILYHFPRNSFGQINRVSDENRNVPISSDFTNFYEISRCRYIIAYEQQINIYNSKYACNVAKMYRSKCTRISLPNCNKKELGNYKKFLNAKEVYLSIEV